MSWCDPPWRRARAWPIVAAVLLLAGCGFHFRGDVDLPPRMSVIHVVATDRYTPFYRELVTVLRRSDVTLAQDPSGARTIIRILDDDTGRRLLSVTSRNVPAEYEVYYRVRFAVEVDGEPVVPMEQIGLTRDYAFDETAVLGKAGEEEIIRQAIASDLVGLVTRRLAAVH